MNRSLVKTVLLTLAVVAANSALASSGDSTMDCCRLTTSNGPSHQIELVEPWSTWRAITGKTTLSNFPLQHHLKVDLALERFRVTHSGTRFVLGRTQDGQAGCDDCEDQLIDFDTDSVVLLRGTIADDPSSRAFLALTEHGSLGTIDYQGQRYRIASQQPRQLTVTLAPMAGGSALDVPMCGTDDSELSQKLLVQQVATNALVGAPPLIGSRPQVGAPPIRGLRQLEVAVETDYEFFQLFNDLDAASAYVVAAYAAVSEVYVRDTGARIDLSFVRLWDDPADLFNEPDPLGSFQSHWEANMGAVQRDVAQFFTGRRNLPYGGVAFLGGLCGSQGYSVAGYILGFFDDPTSPSVVNRDITVSAHELGHSSGSPHTHSLGIDTCDDENSTAQRGTIMSYCGQTFTGGASNTDLRFHTGTQTIMEDLFANSACLVADCNQNANDDALDIALGASADVNMNSIPDECEDCNSNGVLDDADISGGTSNDLNMNGIPDECEADCNTNSIPDDIDISQGTSDDLYGNGIPDECEADCNSNSMPDYDEIQADMSLDLNRNAMLDACEDCDRDTVPDLEALDHANNVWLASIDHTRVREYLAKVGPLTSVSDDAGIAEGQDLLITADRRILVSSRLDHRVVEIAMDGTITGDLVASGTGGLSEPAGMALTTDGRLLVASRGTHSVLAYNSTTGAFLGEMVAASTGGLTAPFGLAFRPGDGGNLLVTSSDNRVLEFNSLNGNLIGEVVSVADNGGLIDPHGLLVLPSGNLLVASYGSNQVLEFDGSTGAFVRQFNQGGTATRLTLDQPWGLRLGPDGGVYVSRAHDHEDRRPEPLHLTNARIYHFDATTGFLLRAYVLGVNSGVEHPTGFDFVPGDTIDCNLNLIPDSCDISNGTASDEDGNGVPDSCGVGSGIIFQDSFESGDTSAW